MSSETCASHRLSSVKLEKCHNSVIYEPISKIKIKIHRISSIGSFLCRFCCLFRFFFLNFVKNEFWNLCVAQAFWGQNVKVPLFCYLWTNCNNLKTNHQISSIGTFMCRFCCLFRKFLNFVKKWVLIPVRRTGFLMSKWKSAIILLFMNYFQQFKNLSSNLINWKLFV